MPVFGMRTMSDLYQSRGVKVSDIILSTVGAMGGMGLLLTLVGLYGLVAYAVSRRTREIGIRMAVGARPWSVLALVLRRGVVLTLLGLVLGAIGSMAADRAMEGAMLRWPATRSSAHHSRKDLPELLLAAARLP